MPTRTRSSTAPCPRDRRSSHRSHQDQRVRLIAPPTDPGQTLDNYNCQRLATIEPNQSFNSDQIAEGISVQRWVRACLKLTAIESRRPSGAIMLSANRYSASCCVAPSSESISLSRRISISRSQIRPPVEVESVSRDSPLPSLSTNKAPRTRICCVLAAASNPIYSRSVSAGPHVSIHTTAGS
jgi:hypothetical protein